MGARGLGVHNSLRPNAAWSEQHVALGCLVIVLSYVPVFFQAGLVSTSAVVLLGALIEGAALAGLRVGWHDGGRLLVLLAPSVTLAAVVCLHGSASQLALFFLPLLQLVHVLFEPHEARLRVAGVGVVCVSFGAAMFGAVGPVGPDISRTIPLFPAHVLPLAIGALALVMLAARPPRARQRSRPEPRGAPPAVSEELLTRLRHELLTPLHGILGLTDLLRDDGLSDHQRRILGQLRESGERLHDLIEDIQFLYAHGPVSGAVRPTRLDKLVERVAERYTREAWERGLSLVVDVRQAAETAVLGPPELIERLVSHVVHNAVKFTRQGGVTVRLRVRPEGREVKVELVVEDTGVGIPARLRRLVLDPFVQLDHGPTRRADGMGVGLAVCRRIVAALHGTITLEGGPGGGSVVVTRFVLPAAPVERPAPPASSSLHALVAEDNPVNRTVLQGYLARLGVSCDLVHDGGAACAAFDPLRHDVVLLDVHMPGMSGLEVLDQLRAQQPDLHAVAITADPHAAAMHGGFRSVLGKPLAAGDLADALRDVFPSRFRMVPSS